MMMENGGKAVGALKEALAIKAAVAACDTLDGVKDGVIRDPRGCNYSAAALIGKGLTAGEAKAIDRIWDGPRTLNGRYCTTPLYSTRAFFLFFFASYLYPISDTMTHVHAVDAHSPSSPNTTTITTHIHRPPALPSV